MGIEHGVGPRRVLAASTFIAGHIGHGLRSQTFLAGGRPVTRPLPGTDAEPAV